MEVITIVGSERFVTTVELPATVSPEERAVLDVYVDWLRVIAEFSDPWQVDHPRLASILTETVHEKLVEGRLPKVRAGYFATGEAQSRPIVAEISATRATVTDCRADTTTLFDGQGSVVSGPTPATEYDAAFVRGENGAWRLESWGPNGAPCES
ncbi:MAG: hypothetical protein OEY23_05530 [Acidimicrobiia bacterium]|nr:hypothetical protein [Acidimicrobiia bacterium]